MRKGDVKYIVARRKDGFEIIDIILLVDRGSRRHRTFAHPLIKMRKIRLLAEIVTVLFSVEHIRHTDHIQAERFGLGIPKFAIGIAKQFIHISHPFLRLNLLNLL